MSAGTRDNRTRAAIIAGFLVGLSALLAALLVPVMRQMQLERAITRSARMFRVGYASHIQLADFTDFEWDAVHIFSPYTLPDAVDRSLGFEWTRTVRTSISQNDSVSLLVFVHDGRVVRWIEMPRAPIDFSTVAVGSPYTAEEARFFFPDDNTPALGVLR